MKKILGDLSLTGFIRQHKFFMQKVDSRPGPDLSLFEAPLTSGEGLG